MSFPPGISHIHLPEWQNGHQNFKVSLQDGCFDMRLPFALDRHSDNYHASTKNFQWLIGDAIRRNSTLRALGNGWSFTEVNTCEGGLVDTRDLRNFFRMNDALIRPEYRARGGIPDRLIFTECGMSILQLNRELEEENGWKLAIRASGASNGQTIAGATSTGTHGAAYHVGAVHDSIVGLHLVTGPDRHVWLERQTQPVASDQFLQWLGATPLRDDHLFNAALVAFGSFGFIHGVMLEVEPIYLLEKFTSARIPYNEALRAAINHLDFEAFEPVLPFPVSATNRNLYHFEILVNPHQFAEDDPDKGVYLKVMYKVPYRDGYPKPAEASGNFQYGDELLGIIQTILDNLGHLGEGLIPKLVNKFFPLAFASNEQTTGTIGETFTNTKFRGQAASMAIAVDVSNTSAALEEIVRMNAENPFPGGLAIRFVKGTNALLGFTRFPRTCVLELDGVDSATSRRFFEKVWERFDDMGLPYTLHWGKINSWLNEERIRRMYGDDRVDTWIAARHQLLDEPARKVFTNALMRKWGLDK